MAEEDPSPISHPTISPAQFDLIVYGTGLPESLIAAAASAAGKSVLHIDHNSFYGSHFSSLPLPSFSSFLHSSPNPNSRPLFSDVEITNSPLPDPSHRFLLDLSGPRVFVTVLGIGGGRIEGNSSIQNLRFWREDWD